MDDKLLQHIPEDPGNMPPMWADIPPVEGDDAQESLRMEKYQKVGREYLAKFDNYRKWVASLNPEMFVETLTNIEESVPSNREEAERNAVSFAHYMLLVISMAITALNKIVPDVTYELVANVENKTGRSTSAGFSPFSVRFADYPNTAYKTEKHGHAYHHGIALSAHIARHSEGVLSLISSAGQSSYWLPTEIREQLRKTNPALIKLGESLPERGKDTKARVPDGDRIAFTWERVHSRRKNYVATVVDMSLHDKFHEARDKVYNDALRDGKSLLEAGDIAESATTQIMEKLGLL